MQSWNSKSKGTEDMFPKKQKAHMTKIMCAFCGSPGSLYFKRHSGSQPIKTASREQPAGQAATVFC